MSTSRHQRVRNGKRRNEYRLREIRFADQPRAMFSASNIHYEMGERAHGLSPGGIGAIHKLAQRTGLRHAIDQRLHLLKAHLPYHESDHVLNIAYNLLCGGGSLEDLELLRNDEVYADALGAKRIPDPTTAGDFCRRFRPDTIECLFDAIDEARLRVWRSQPRSFFTEAIVDVDGVVTETSAECKDGIDIAYNGKWGYHPLVVSLANTQEPLYLVNRPGNRPSHDGAARWLDRAIALCRRGSFRYITLRGDTDFTQTAHLDRWDELDVRFVFGCDARANLVEKAESLPENAWERLERDPRYVVRTQPRSRPRRVKQEIVRRREFERIRTDSEDVAEFDYSPARCKKTYRMIVLRKNLSIEKGEKVLFDDIRYFFFLTNDAVAPASHIVFDANQRCNQENLNAQLRAVGAFRMPVDHLVSNWAYMVMASLAWTLKVWFALLLPTRGRWRKKRQAERDAVLRMEFRTFTQGFLNLPVQIVRQGRKIVYRVLAWSRWLAVFFRGWDHLQTVELRC